ncbi:CPBP family glutamic-type intramembrane protease [Methanomicrobium antiquum]|uniref:CPBP family glutamic-type intramembrane protease n=1 Tax=Methanomicrobium antiquum TaxID=487686 RepID=A0AAF0FUC5_9EURY|nr:CPBP family glutamic-type intramembrane protease [Methanomicrobium antiquum]MDD3977854.1 CPBP family glutamic-type intramembrane protease [Methanomicrobium sp.]WFN36668.1 CPBP family glutamic-type intramembrane protease [Methanomicrobium antiquum]
MNHNFEFLNKKMLGVLFAVLFVCTIIPFTDVFPDYITNFALSAIQVAPFILLAFFAYMSEKYPGLKIFTTIWLLVIILIIAMTSFGVAFISLMPAEIINTPASEGIEEYISENIEEIFLKSAFLLFSVLLAAILSLAGQIRNFRILLSGYIPINPDSFVHKTALTAVLAMTLIPLVPLLVTGNPPYLSPVFLEMAAVEQAFSEIVSLDVFSLFWMILASFIIAGLYINKKYPEVLKRLGIVKPTKNELLLSVGAGILLVGVFFVIEHVISAIWGFFGWSVTDSDSVNLLFSAYLTPVTALVAAISAGFGEEIAVRGLLQPRLGIIIPSLLFASLHAFQYSWDGVLSVFIAGIIFAIIRRHYNTTFSAVTHSVYDIILFYAIMLGISI